MQSDINTLNWNWKVSFPNYLYYKRTFFTTAKNKSIIGECSVRRPVAIGERMPMKNLSKKYLHIAYACKLCQ